MRLGYARVSTKDQDTVAQLAALEGAKCDHVFQEKASGGRWERPQLRQLLDQLQTDDVVVVWKLDQLSRSLKDLLLVLEKIDQVGAHFQSLTEAIDTSTSAGRMMMHLVGSFAEFERSLLRERTRAGLEEARKAGRVGGRRPKLTPTQQQEVIDLVSSGQKSAADAARRFRVHPATVSRLLARQPPPLPAPNPPAEPKNKSARRKTASRKKRSSRKASPAVMVSLDAIGLARPEVLRDSPSAVRLLVEKTRPRQMMERTEWNWGPVSDPQFLSVAAAEETIVSFRQHHANARMEQSYLFENKSAIRLTAYYEDGVPDHRLTYSAYDR